MNSPVFYQNIKNKKALFISYRPFNHDSNFSGIVSPYLLKEYRNRWYLIAKFHNDNHIYHYALDRLRDAKISFQEYRPEPDFNPDLYFKNIIGVTLPKDGQLTKIQFKSNYAQANYIKTKPIHPSQTIISQTPDYTIFEIEVFPNYELESTLLAFGENVEVLEPEYLRKRLQERIKKLHMNYLRNNID
ncbi:MAG TPA: WYL domain-containing protein [Saprospiraceae bacterium]|nr:WYL domain-containing protein [Saprospiraceae bacterium]